MKTYNNTDGSKTFAMSQFETEMSGIMFKLYGGTTEAPDKQPGWDQIQYLKSLLREEILKELAIEAMR